MIAALRGKLLTQKDDSLVIDVNCVGYLVSVTSGVLQDAHKWLADSRPDWFDGMVIAETEANTLEAAQLVAMRELPTRKVELLRAAPPNIPALWLLIKEFSGELAPNAIPGETPLHRYYTPAVPH